MLRHRPDLLVVDSAWLPEVYFAFQFDEGGVQPALGAVVQELKRAASDLDIAHWLIRPNRMLGLSSPLAVATGKGDVARVLQAAELDGLVVGKPVGSAILPVPAPGPTGPEATPSVRPPVRRRRLHRPIFHGS